MRVWEDELCILFELIQIIMFAQSSPVYQADSMLRPSAVHSRLLSYLPAYMGEEDTEAAAAIGSL